MKTFIASSLSNDKELKSGQSIVVGAPDYHDFMVMKTIVQALTGQHFYFEEIDSENLAETLKECKQSKAVSPF